MQTTKQEWKLIYSNKQVHNKFYFSKHDIHVKPAVQPKVSYLKLAFFFDNYKTLHT